MPPSLTTLPSGASASCHRATSPIDLTFVEFFAGIGLIHEALKPLGWHCMLANDNDPRKVATYRKNFSSNIVEADIRELPVESIPTAALATASFPCIDLSQAGGRRGINGAHSGIVWSFLDRINELAKAGRAPKYLLLENVAGLLTLHGGKSIDLLLAEITHLGYAFDLIQVDAQHFIPQARNRAFIIAVRDRSLATGEPMSNTHIRRYKIQHIYQRNRELPWMFFDFPDPPSRLIELCDVLEDLSETDPRWWDNGRMEYFWDHLENDHRRRLCTMVKSGVNVQMTAVRRGRRRGLREQIFNLRFDALASCLRTPKGGSSIQFIVQVRDGQARVRRILGIESARLQGVAMATHSPDFVVPVSEQEALFAFGDAVCVPAVQWVVAHSIQKLIHEAGCYVGDRLTLDLVGMA